MNTRPGPFPRPVRSRWLLRSPWPVVAVVVTALLGVVAAFALHQAGTSKYTYQRLDTPPRTLVRDHAGTVVATLTDGARTALIRGPSRTFAEPGTTAATVTTRAWLRPAPRPWRHDDPSLRRWLTAALTDREPDILAIAMQYRRDAPDKVDTDGTRIAGRASYGPLKDGERAENSDFNDYLGLDWTYPDGTRRRALPDHYGALDCSGYVRMVFGYRSGYPLERGEATGTALPRRAVMMATEGPGVHLIPDRGTPPTDLSTLQPGDLLFFDADPQDGPDIDHVGIYLGLDNRNQPRFLSSRKIANGPTMGDLGGPSLLTGTGLYARAFRSAKRL